jgi:hypothetical protein
VPFYFDTLIFNEIFIFLHGCNVSRMTDGLPHVPANEFKRTWAIQLFTFRQNDKTATGSGLAGEIDIDPLAENTLRYGLRVTV